MTITKEEARILSTEIERAVKKILEDKGLELTKMSTTFGDIFAVKVQASKVARGVNGVNVASEYATAYKHFGSSYGIKAGLLGKKFTNKGTEYAFAGLAVSRSKFPVVGLSMSDNRIYFFTNAAVEKVNA